MTPDTKVTILCNPQNPVGRAWTKDELTAMARLCLKHNVKVLSDEIHCDFVTKGKKYTPFSTLDDKKIVDNCITFKSGSKCFSLPAMKCAWFFTTNPEIYKEVLVLEPRGSVDLGHARRAGGLCRRRGLAEPVRRLYRRQPGIRQRLHQEEHSR